MKGIAGMLVSLVVMLGACHETETTTTSDFTGNEMKYPLLRGNSQYDIYGTVTFKEKKDASTLIELELTGTNGEIQHPVHLHFGNIATDNANVAALLNPVYGKTGVSQTVLTQLADETRVTYRDLVQYNACVKVHLSDAGPDKDVILAGGDIGIAYTPDNASGRAGMAVCKSK